MTLFIVENYALQHLSKSEDLQRDTKVNCGLLIN